MVKRNSRYKDHPYLQFVIKFVVDAIIVVCLAMTLINNVFSRATVSGNSMNQVLLNDDSVFINHYAYAFSSPKRYDVIAFQLSGTNSEKVYFKRIIGLPGEKIQIIEGKVYINGKVLEDDIEGESIIFGGLATNELTIGQDEYFVLGDNRNSSEDSRFANIGLVDSKKILGKPWLIYTPFSRFGFIG